MRGRAGSGPAGIPRRLAQKAGPAAVDPHPLGLVAQTSKGFDTADSCTTDPIDTTGATYLLIHYCYHTTATITSATDNKGNLWSLTTNQQDGTGTVRVRTAVPTSNNPIVTGPGHTFTIVGTGTYPAIHFSAWKSSIPISLGTIASAGGNLPHGPGNLTTGTDGELVISSVGSVDNLTGVSQGTILCNLPNNSGQYALGVAYNIVPTSGTILNPVWSSGSTGTAAVGIDAYRGTWLDATASDGLASGVGAATAVGLSTALPLGLIAQSSSGGVNNFSTTTPAIDTTGATLLVVNFSHLEFNTAALSDNKGNTWTQLYNTLDNVSSPLVRSKLYYVNSQTPNVGSGHTVTVDGGATYPAANFMAWRSGTAWSSSVSGTASGMLPHGAGGVTTAANNQLLISTAGSASYFTTVSQGTVLANLPPTGNSYGAASAYKIVPTSGTAIDFIWTSDPPYAGAVTIQAFSGTWLDANASDGLASGVGTAAAVAVPGPSVGSAAGVGAATAIALIASVGSASGVGAATGVSPSTAVQSNGLVAHTAACDPATATPGINTTGANLLLLTFTWYGGASEPSFTDSKGNTWTALGSQQGDGNFAAYTRVYYVNSQTPSVGTNHTINWSGGAGNAFVFSAWKSSTTWVFDEIHSAGGITPLSGRPTVSPTADELIVSHAGSNGHSFISINSGWAILDNIPYATSYSGAFAFFNGDPSITTADAIWAPDFSASFISYQIFAFTGTWDLFDHGIGDARGQGTATGFSSNALVRAYTPGSNRNDFSGRVGVRFTATTGQIYNKIGVRCGTSNTGLHYVGLYDSGGTLLRTANVDLTGGTVGTFYYSDIASITLTNGSQYYLATNTSGGDGQQWADEGPTTLFPGVTGVASAYYDGSWHTNTGNYQYVGVDLDYLPVADTGVGLASGIGLAAAQAPAGVDSYAAGASAGIGVAAAQSRSDVRPAGTSAGVGAATATGRDDGIGVGAAAGLGAATATGRDDGIGAGAAAGFGAATATGRADANSAAASAGLGTASGSSAAGLDSPAPGTSAGLGVATAGGRSDARSAITSAGIGAATGTGRSDAPSAGVSSGVGAALGQGKADALYTGTAAGIGTATGTRTSDVRAAGTAAGIGTATAVGDDKSIGSAAGIGAAVSTGRADALLVGNAAGIGAAVSTGRDDFRAVGNAAGVGEAVALADASATTGDSIGHGVAAGVGRSDARAAGTAAGIGAAAAVGRADFIAVGVAAGLGTATGQNTSDARSAGTAAGVGVAAGSSAAGLERFADGAAAGVGAAVGQGKSDARAAGTAAGIGTAAGTSFAGLDSPAVGASAGLGTATGQGRADARIAGTAAGVGTATTVGRDDFIASGVAAGTGAAAGIGRADARSAGVAAGIGAAVSTGAAGAIGTGAAAGVGAAVGLADIGSTTGRAAGVGTAAGAGRSDVRVAGAAAGLGAAVGQGSSDVRRAGTAAGIGLATGVGIWTGIEALSVGTSAGLGTASASIKVDVGAVGHASGLGTAIANVLIDIRSVGHATGVGRAVSFSVEPGSVIKVVDLIGYRSPPVALVGVSDNEVALTGYPDVDVALSGQRSTTITLTGRRKSRVVLTGDLGDP
jgi:hypothetical protein